MRLLLYWAAVAANRVSVVAANLLLRTPLPLTGRPWALALRAWAWSGRLARRLDPERAAASEERVWERAERRMRRRFERTGSRVGLGWLEYPADLPPRYNGGTRCDALRGPCACGAWHDGEEA